MSGDDEMDYRASDDPQLQPLRDPDTGEVVTLTGLQCAAVEQALRIHARVQDIEREKGRARMPAFDSRAVLAASATLYKSCLMGRLLHDGKPPLVDAPPVVFAAPDYSREVPR